MDIKSELTAIGLELKSIEESKDRIRDYAKEINKRNPFSMREILEGNDFRHNGKKFIADKFYVGNSSRKDIELHPDTKPVYFIAEGIVLKKGGEKSVYRTTRAVEIEI
jgi:hypothetical protein